VVTDSSAASGEWNSGHDRNAGPPHGPGRPTVSTPELRDRIFELLWDGVPLRVMCRADGMPSRATMGCGGPSGCPGGHTDPASDEVVGTLSEETVELLGIQSIGPSG
jgi:hypothetical protein